jgi:hypothetical protein
MQYDTHQCAEIAGILKEVLQQKCGTMRAKYRGSGTKEGYPHQR